MRGVFGLGVFVFGALGSGPAGSAQAREYREQVGDWQVRAFSAGRCSATRDFSDGTYVSVSTISDGRAHLTVLNRAWPLRITDSYRLELVQGGLRRKIAAEDDKTFQGLSLSTPDGGALLAQLAEGGSVEVTGADGVLLKQVDLGGIASALARLRPCVAEIATAANFPALAPPPPPPPPPGRSDQVRPARAQAPLPQLLSSEDYPASAVRAGEQGIVRFRLDIGTTGRVSACTIITSSASMALDSATCRLIRARARFVPAVDRKGRPTTDSVVGRIDWRLPKPEPPPPPAE